MSDINAIAKLSHNQFSSIIRDYLDAKATKKKAEADSRKADGVIKNLRSTIFLALKGATIGRCDNAIITVKPEKRNPGALTMHDGRSIPLEAIKEIVFITDKGTHDVVNASDVKTWYGGATIGADLEITLTGDTV